MKLVLKTYGTRRAAARIGVSLRTLRRWMARGLIRASKSLPMSGGYTLWRWTDANIKKGRKVKATQKRGRKPRTR